jgi:hypothetical protein
VFEQQIAIVIGPTPGTGVIAPATATRLEVDVADEAAAALGGWRPRPSCSPRR